MIDFRSLLALVAIVGLAFAAYKYLYKPKTENTETPKPDNTTTPADDSVPWTGYARMMDGQYKGMWIILSTRKSPTKGFNSLYSLITLPKVTEYGYFANLESAKYIYESVRDGGTINGAVYTSKDFVYTVSKNAANVDLITFIEA